MIPTRDADAVYTNKTPVSEKTIKACNNIKFIGLLATGYNVVDVVAAKEAGEKQKTGASGITH